MKKFLIASVASLFLAAFAFAGEGKECPKDAKCDKEAKKECCSKDSKKCCDKDAKKECSEKGKEAKK
jgi:hypothetical protein